MYLLISFVFATLQWKKLIMHEVGAKMIIIKDKTNIREVKTLVIIFHFFYI